MVFMDFFSLQGLTKERMRRWNHVSTSHRNQQSTGTYLASSKEKCKEKKEYFFFLNCSWQADPTVLPQFSHICANNDVV